MTKPFDLVRLFAALADPTRLRLLNLMDGREVCVCYFVEILKQGQPKISRHLAYLRNAGIVSARREGKWMNYRMERPDDAGACAILDATLLSCKADREMQSDLARLGNACCEPQRFVTLQGAPVPTRLENSAHRIGQMPGPETAKTHLTRLLK
jgi:ArsR family transcriptional regulator, arsenate/arsenite/antimonite-responsive transcriptional repressor